MNIFALSDDPVTAARYQCDVHVVKMCLESAQLLCSYYDVCDAAPLKRTHYNHPCARWARESTGNWSWLLRHTTALFDEYKYRYGKTHSLAYVVGWVMDHPPNLPVREQNEFAMAIPLGYVHDDGAVAAYRRYYIFEKRRFARYTRRKPPDWLLQALSQPPTLPFTGPKKARAIGLPVKIEADHVVVSLCDSTVRGLPAVDPHMLRVFYDGTVEHATWRLADGYKRPLKEIATTTRNV